jgi:hypothetical protein
MAGRSDERETEIDRLYALPLDEFTAARDELARRLRRDGEGDAAAEVKRLRKPSLSAWALNQVRRSNPEQVEQLLDAGRRLRDAHDELLGGGAREPLSLATDDERRLVTELARHAERELVAAGRPVSASVQERLRGTLHAAATDPEARQLLASGRLVRDHAASGLGPLVESETAAPRQRRKRSPEGDDGALAQRARQLEERLARARERQQEAEEELSDARRRLREARREAVRAASALERAEAAEQQAGGRARDASDRAAELEAALRELHAAGGRDRKR